MNDLEKNGIEFQIHIDYDKGCTVSSKIANVDAKKNLSEAICTAVKTHLDKFHIGDKINRVTIDMKDI